MMPAATFALENEKDKSRERFVVYYADTAPLTQFKPYQLVVLDSTHHPDLLPLKEEDKVILGYLTLGEVDKNSRSYALLKERNLILQENPNWKGSYYVDMRDPLWAKIVLEDLIPSILRQGFDGLFLDTLDNPLALEEQNREKYAGMRDAALHMVQAIRMHYPSIKIMMNRAYGILPKVAPLIDMEMAESLYAGYDFGKKEYKLVPDADYQAQLQILQGIKKKHPKLKIYTLDYAAPSDRSAAKEIYRVERANGFIPYVATIGLDKIIEEPGTP